MKALLIELRRWHLQRVPKCQECLWPGQIRRIRKPLALYLADQHTELHGHRVKVKRFG